MLRFREIRGLGGWVERYNVVAVLGVMGFYFEDVVCEL